MAMAMPQRLRTLVQRFAEPLRFLIGGSVVTLTAHAVYLLALYVTGPYQAWTVSFIFGTVFGYFVHRRYVFRVEALRHHLLTFPAIYLLRFAISQGVLALMLWLGLTEGWAGFITNLTMAPVGYVLLRASLRGTR